MAVEDLVKTVMSEMRQMARTQNVVAEPIKLGEDVVVVPVSKISLGFGAGGGASQENEEVGGGSGSGTGGGISIDPVAFIVVSSGKPTLLPLAKTEATISKVIDLVPEVLGKLGSINLGNKKAIEGKELAEEPEEEEE
jgi:sporulation protein YtfJ